jgi:hypothetical protein
MNKMMANNQVKADQQSVNDFAQNQMPQMSDQTIQEYLKNNPVQPLQMGGQQ